jgi:hypothetical protein
MQYALCSADTSMFQVYNSQCNLFKLKITATALSVISLRHTQCALSSIFVHLCYYKY